MSKTNKIHAAVYTILGLALIFAIIMWIRCYNRNKNLDTAVNNGYDRAFFELTDYVNNIDSLLSKAQIASSPSQLASISNEIFMQSAAAKSCFGELPQEDVNLENTAKFLSQVGDYTFVLTQKMINGETITDEEYDTLNKLNEYASKLGRNLSEMEQKIYSGELDLKTADASLIIQAFADDGGILADLENVEKSFEGYPSLIYDGPFSEHIENQESYMIKDAEEISQAEAMRRAAEFLGDRGKNLKFENEMTNTAIDAYCFGKSENGNHLTISVTKKGGYILYFLEHRDVSKSKYNIDKATERAQSFLEEHGFRDMVSSYYESGDNVATINFAYSQDGVKCYSDLIKVKVALDSGDVIGMESKGYLMNHHVRDVSGAVLNDDEAKACVSAHLDVSVASLAVIPKDSLREVLCYEFKGAYMGKNFIVYVNAETGREEDILLLIESPEGVLTI
ncbi:MAG: germination protein YpeB [Oscillospiraceae bacterium]|nr:germination protein YpeB [Oscillospiraceae bacterium]